MTSRASATPQVEGQPELAGVEGVELQGVLLPSLVADERVHATQHVGPALGLDLDDGRAVVGQHPGCAGSGKRPHEVEHLQPLERPVGAGALRDTRRWRGSARIRSPSAPSAGAGARAASGVRPKRATGPG